MKDKIIKIIKNILSTVTLLGLLFLIVFGLKTCIFDHDHRLDSAIAWCEAKHVEHDKNPDKFIAYYQEHQIDRYKLFLENTSEERKVSLPAEFSITPDNIINCEIVYCSKIGLSSCLYDFQNKTLSRTTD